MMGSSWLPPIICVYVCVYCVHNKNIKVVRKIFISWEFLFLDQDKHIGAWILNNFMEGTHKQERQFSSEIPALFTRRSPANSWMGCAYLRSLVQKSFGQSIELGANLHKWPNV